MHVSHFLFCAALPSDKNAVRGTHYKMYHKILKDGNSLTMKEITDKECTF
jgi:histidinol phosphatase-like enzyme